MDSPKSFKTIMKDRTIKGTDAMSICYVRVRAKPDFHLRDLDDEYEAGIEDLTGYIMAGGIPYSIKKIFASREKLGSQGISPPGSFAEQTRFLRLSSCR